ncbi:lipase [Rhodococcus spelaei]|uniref:Lipase n=1 Tax=Rhodococcus spelaei TaxID=2546320 RepID=A0A541BMV9_9NOCA|nr:lipase family protein [Rhodococcus spelaei]TQF73662.1 lipase [Rhodococcus spelaei]
MVASLRACAAVVVAAAAITLAAPAAATGTSAADPVVASRPLPQSSWIPGAASGTALTYRTLGPRSAPATSTGAVFLPPGTPPPGGWPVISWAHGAVGIADACAPTVTGKIGGPYLGRWLAQGYAIVATDYVGLGTEGVHPYLDGMSEAHAVVDIVRAARVVEPSLSNRWVALGQSQGGQAAMVTATIATSYAPELDYRGTIALGVPSNIENLAPLGGPLFPPLPLTGTTTFIAYMLAGLRAARPDVDVDAYLSPRGRQVLAQAEQLCYEEADAAFGSTSIGALFSRQLDGPILAAVRKMLEIPTRGYDRPLFLGQGLLDTIVPAPLTLKLAADLAAAGQRFTFRVYPKGHLETMLASEPEANAFVQHLFAPT